MAAMIYLFGLAGSVRESKYEHWNRIREVQFTFPHPVKGPGEFVVTMDLDATTATLIQRAHSGRAFQYVRVHWLGKDDAPYLKVRFDQVFVTSIHTQAPAAASPAIYAGFLADRWQYEE